METKQYWCLGILAAGHSRSTEAEGKVGHEELRLLYLSSFSLHSIRALEQKRFTIKLPP